MRIVIAGSGRTGTDLAESLAEDGHDVSVIDEDADAFKALGSTFDGATFQGVAYDVRILKKAGIELADAFIAVTNSDNANLMAVELAKSVFAVPKTIARLDDPARAQAYHALDVHYVAAAQLTSRVIYEQVVEGEFDYHVTFPFGDVEVVEMTLGEDAEGLTVGEFQIEGGLRVAAISRGNRIEIPDDSFALQEGDLVVAAARRGIRSRVVRYLVDRDRGTT